mgnify:CR=1 FL=1
MRCPLAIAAVFGMIASMLPAPAQSQVMRTATSTLTPVELNHGETLAFTLANGETRELTLQDTWVDIVVTNLEDVSTGNVHGRTVYCFGARVLVDGQPLTLSRYVPTQQSYYEPYFINGMRVWFDAVKAIGNRFNETHGDCLPEKDARFAVQDATLPDCGEQRLRAWYPNASNRLDAHDAYQGDDVWLGPYFGSDLHGGLDVNMPVGTPIWAPIDFDDQFLFHSIAAGQANNRWRGLKTWSSGHTWALQVHHVTRMLVPEHNAVKQGTHLAEAAGELIGLYAHSHFEFKIDEGRGQGFITLDPWILFHEIFENNREAAGEIRASMQPLNPARTGEAVAFDAGGSSPGVTGNGLTYYWTFGDGGFAVGPQAEHVFAEPGVHRVTLVVDDGVDRERMVQHLTVKGPRVDRPVLRLAAPREASFTRASPGVTTAYGEPVKYSPHTMRFVFRGGQGKAPPPRNVEIKNAGGGELGTIRFEVEQLRRDGWLEVELVEHAGGPRLRLAVRDVDKKPRERHDRALVSVFAEAAVNSPQVFFVDRIDPHIKPATDFIVHHGDKACTLSATGWVEPRFRRGWRRGSEGRYCLISDGSGDAWARFRPHLTSGRYELSIPEATSFALTHNQRPVAGRFNVRIKHQGGESVVRVDPSKARTIGRFYFAEGNDGFAQIEAEGDGGLVIADGIRFRRISP